MTMEAAVLPGTPRVVIEQYKTLAERARERVFGIIEEDVVILAVANPKSDQYPYNQDVSEDEVKRFLEENGYTYPVAMDTTGEVFAAYGVRAFPTTFMIDREGNVFGYVESTLTRDIMDSIVQQTLDGRRAG